MLMMKVGLMLSIHVFVARGHISNINMLIMLALVINRQRSDSSPVFAMGRGSEAEIGPGSRLVDIGPAVEFLPDEVVAERVAQDFVARDRSSRYDGSGPLPRDAPRL